MNFAVVFNLAMFTYENKTYCLPGYERSDENATKCVPARVDSDYTWKTGGFRLPACKVGTRVTIPRAGLGLNEKDGSQEFCEVCAGGPGANLSRCERFPFMLRISGCEEYAVIIRNNSTNSTTVVDQDPDTIIQQQVRCIKCNDTTYLLDNFTCVNGTKIAGCYMHKSVDQCALCELGYAISLDGKTCTEIANCDENFRALGGCLKCNDGYVYVEATNSCIAACGAGELLFKGNCAKAQPACETHNFQGNLTKNNFVPCADCKLGYYLDQPSAECQNCLPHCLKCESNGTCKSNWCENGYIFDPSLGQCQDNVTACSDISNCAECRVFDQITKDAIKNVRRCVRCDSTYSLSPDGEQCFSCQLPYCVKCSGTNSCGTCAKGFEPITAKNGSNICFAVGDNRNCTVWNENGFCLQCDAQYVLSTRGICVHAHGCASFSIQDGELYCDDCVGQTVERLDGVHLCDIKGCEAYDNGTAECTKCCADGTKPETAGKCYLKDGTCYACHESCKACAPKADDGEIFSKCTACSGNHILDDENSLFGAPHSHLCFECKDLDAHCVTCGFDGTCSQCLNNYVVKDGQCKSCEELGFFDCQHCNTTQCIECAANFTWNDVQCMPCADRFGACQSCGTASCLKPAPATYFIGKVYYYCGDEHCLECGGNLLRECTKCAATYYLADNVCRPCQHKYGSQCLECNTDRCTKCAPGLTYSSDTKECVPCRHEFGQYCSTCDTYSCTRCATDRHGYDLASKTCRQCNITGCARCVFAPNSGNQHCLECINPQEAPDASRKECVQVPADDSCQIWEYAVTESGLQFNCLKCVRRNYTYQETRCAPVDDKTR